MWDTANQSHSDLTPDDPQYTEETLPYSPEMLECKRENLIKYVDLCTEWSVEEEEFYTAETGPLIRFEKRIKYLDGDKHRIESKIFQIGGCVVPHRWVFKIYNLVRDEELVLKLNLFNPNAEPWYKTVLHFVFINNRRDQISSALDICFSDDYKPIALHCDDKFYIRVNTCVSFGDLSKASMTERLEVPTPSHYINTVRPFYPGFYIVSVLVPFEGCSPISIFHHRDVDPLKVWTRIVLMHQDFNNMPENKFSDMNANNYIDYWDSGSSSYESMSPDSQEYVSEEEKLRLQEEKDKAQDESFTKELADKMKKIEIDELNDLSSRKRTIYFCLTEKAALLPGMVKNGSFHKSEVHPGHFLVNGTNDERIALAMDVEEHTESSDVHGRLFQDAESDMYFALVVFSCLGRLNSNSGNYQELFWKYKDVPWTSVKQTKLIFDLVDFI